MEKLKEVFKKLWARFKSFSKRIRIAIIVAIVAVLIAIISLVIYTSSNKYSVLYADLDPADITTVVAKLEEDKIEKKVDGNSILVPTEKVDELRLELASKLTSGSSGYELMDSGSSFGMTDEEFGIKKIRMIQGEIEKSIKSLEPIESAKVNITAGEDSVFVTNKTPATAAVVLKLKSGKTITEDQVKSIVALVSRSVENLPEENVEVIDTNMNLLTKNISSGDGSTVSSESILKQQELETTYEDKLSKSIVTLLEKVVGKNKVSATVNADLDFDSKKITETVVDPNKVPISQKTDKTTTVSGDGTKSESPVDNNMSNTINEEEGTITSTSESQTTNYETGRTQSEIISAPGEVKRLTASVFIDGNYDAATLSNLEKAVAAAVGINTSRGDEISLVNMEFDTTSKEALEEQVAALQKEEADASKIKLIIYTVLGVALVAAIITLFIVKKKKKNEDQRLLDVIIDEKPIIEETEHFAPLDFEVKNEKSHIESEIKNYAKEKPEQVVDIVKAWLTENER